MEPKDWIDVTTEKNHYSLDHFVIPKHYEKDVSSILIPHGVIMVGAFIFLISHTFAGKSNTVRQDRIHKLARLIVDDTTGPLGKAISYLISLTWKLKMSMIKKKVVCCILKGGHQYFADLVNQIKALTKSNGLSVPLSLEFIRVKSYKNDKSEGVTISLSEEECKDFAGKVGIEYTSDSEVAYKIYCY